MSTYSSSVKLCSVLMQIVILIFKYLTTINKFKTNIYIIVIGANSGSLRAGRGVKPPTIVVNLKPPPKKT